MHTKPFAIYDCLIYTMVQEKAEPLYEGDQLKTAVNGN